MLYGIKKSLSLPLPKYKEEINRLKELKYLDTEGSITPEGKKVIVRFENYFVKAKKRTSIQLMGKDFSKRMISAERRSSADIDVAWDEIIDATKMYVNNFESQNYMYMKTSQYFIVKTDKNKVKTSDLMDYVEMIRDGVELDDNHFKEKVV